MADFKKFRAGLVQMTAKGNMAANIQAASQLIRQAAAEGAAFVMTPEVTSLLEPDAKQLFAKLYTQEDDPALQAFCALALELKIWLLIGSQAFKLPGGKLANRSLLINDRGVVTASYDKIHMFDVDLANGESYRESKNYQPGTAGVLAQTAWGAIGLSVCYDIRFPALYRAYAQAGADFLSAPSAFTETTGKAHWHVLLRARAIETGCFMFAPAQYGDHGGGRVTYGHSLVVDPWGAVIADGGTGNGVILADIDTEKVAEARLRIPSLRHDANFKPIVKPIIKNVTK